jgi:uncharacterized protein
LSDYFLDASALVKRYSTETGSNWITQLTDPAAQNTILIAEITVVEVAAALAAKHRANAGISKEQRDRALSRFLQDCDEHFLLLSVDRPVIDYAVELTQNYRLRGYDAVQLATSLISNEAVKTQGLAAPIFIASDNDLLDAAKSVSLSTDNPFNHTGLD